MTPDDRSHIDALFSQQTSHFNDRLDEQGALLREVRDHSIRDNERLKSLEKTRTGVIGAAVLGAASALGSLVIWGLSFIHFGPPKP